ncbi:MAG: MarR family winged helix-turn-helix transcriptional regulator [Phreatobacter sp.]
MPQAKSAAGSKQEAPVTIKDLLSYRISRTANAMSRSAALRYQQFGVTLQEWRTIALLAAESPQALNQLARSAGLDKAQMSRAIASLVERGLVLRKDSEAGGRSIDLTLSRRGEALYKDLIAAAAERDEAFRACLSDEEQRVLDGALGKLHAVARALSHATAPAVGATGGRRRSVED